MQLREMDSLTGSFSTRLRASSNRQASIYDDTKTLNFQSYELASGEGIAMPSGLPVSNSALSNDELTTDIVVTGIARKGVGDSFITFAHGQEFQPFRDNGNPAVDGLSTGDTFYATGSKVSDVGEGFDQPLWSKTKFEIDLTPAVSHSFFIENYTSASNNYPMAYWNTERKVWEGIGAGKEFGLYTAGDVNAVSNICEDQCIGFATGINNGGIGVADLGAGSKISNFGFPYHVKFHATSSNTIAMSDYIDSPFLLEKIVLEWSGSLAFNNTLYGTTTTYTVCTFFILNQRSPFKYNDDVAQSFVYKINAGDTATLALGAYIPASYDGQPERNTIRDLVTYAQIVGFGKFTNETTIARVSRERNIYSGNPELTSFFGSWTGNLLMSGTVKNALPNDGLTVMQLGHNNANSSFLTVNKNSARSGLFTPGGRDFVGSFSKGKVVESTDVLFPVSPGQPTGTVVVLDKQSKINPYLLQPADKLIFGWQLPIASMINSMFGFPQYDGKGTELLFAASPSKITFYGSSISANKEYHDTLDQPLTSMSVHENIK